MLVGIMGCVIMTDSDSSEKEMSKRIAEMVFEPEPDKLIKWLILVSGGQVKYEDDTIFIEPLNGVNHGFLFNSDPITKAVMIASAITSPLMWSRAFPSLLNEVQKLWKINSKKK